MAHESQRHLRRVGRDWLDNFRITLATSYTCPEDDLASNGMRCLADFVTALLKAINSQGRGFAHGHGKEHSIPESTQAQVKCSEEVHRRVLGYLKPGGAGENCISWLFKEASEKFNARLLASAQTRQYESATLPARQLGVSVGPAPFSEKQQRQPRFDGCLEADEEIERPLLEIVDAVQPGHITLENRRAAHGQRQPRNSYRGIRITGCQVCAAPHYLLPQSFGQNYEVGEDGEI